MRSLLSILLVTASAFAQTPLCSQDSAGNQICARTQEDTNICGNPTPFPGGGTHFFPSYHCSDVVIEKTAPGGAKLYTRVLTGESQDLPGQLFLDAQGNAIVVGATYSAQFPTTPDAAQPKHAGPAPVLPSGTAIQAGGDLFLSVLSPTGDLLYSTFLGSSGIDTFLGARQGPATQVDLLIGAGATDFLAASPTLAAGPVLLTFDIGNRKIVKSLYLPIGSSGGYWAEWRADGAIGVTTPKAILSLPARRNTRQRNLSRILCIPVRAFNHHRSRGRSVACRHYHRQPIPRRPACRRSGRSVPVDALRGTQLRLPKPNTVFRARWSHLPRGRHLRTTPVHHSKRPPADSVLRLLIGPRGCTQRSGRTQNAHPRPRISKFFRRQSRRQRVGDLTRRPEPPRRSRVASQARLRERPLPLLCDDAVRRRADRSRTRRKLRACRAARRHPERHRPFPQIARRPFRPGGRHRRAHPLGLRGRCRLRHPICHARR